MIINALQSYKIFVTSSSKGSVKLLLDHFQKARSMCVREMISGKLICVTCTAIRYIFLCNKYVLLIGVRCVTVLANVNFILFVQQIESYEDTVPNNNNNEFIAGQ